MKIREIPVFKKKRYSSWSRILELSFCLWKALLKLGGIMFSNKIPADGTLFLQVDNWFSCQWKAFFLHFSEVPTSNSFFRLGEKHFSTKSFIPDSRNEFPLASGNRFLLLMGFSSNWKPSLKIVESNFKEYILTNENWFSG